MNRAILHSGTSCVHASGPKHTEVCSPRSVYPTLHENVDDVTVPFVESEMPPLSGATIPEHCSEM